MRWLLIAALLAGCTYVYVQTGGSSDQRAVTVENERKTERK